jgi:hypothetical protein
MSGGYGVGRALSATLQAHLAKQMTGDADASSDAFLAEYSDELMAALRLGPAAATALYLELMVDMAEALMSVTEYVAGRTGQTTGDLLGELIRTYRKNYPE